MSQGSIFEPVQQVAKFVLAITVGPASVSKKYAARAQDLAITKKLALRGPVEKQGLGAVLALFYRAMPVASLAATLVAMVGWMGLLGYVAIKLF